MPSDSIGTANATSSAQEESKTAASTSGGTSSIKKDSSVDMQKSLVEQMLSAINPVLVIFQTLYEEKPGEQSYVGALAEAIISARSLDSRYQEMTALRN